MQSPESLRIARPGAAMPMDLGRVLTGYGVNLPSLLDTYCRGCNPPLQPGKDDKARKAAYHRIYRRLNKLAADGIVKLEKGADGLLAAATTNKLLYLISREQSSNHANKDGKRRSIYAWPKNCRPERIDAIRILNEWRHLPPDARKETADHFGTYMQDIEDRRLVLGAADDPENLLVLPYSNRFNNRGRKIEAEKRFDAIFAKSREYYTDAVFLTLTTDPGRFTSLWHANRHFSKALNRFFAFLRKRFGYRLPYIAAYEFTPATGKDGQPKRSGLLHAHMVLFGRRWLMTNQQISDEWSRCGQGMITHAMAMRNDPQHGWTWTRAKPTDHGGKDPQQYLKKYLVKALNSGEGFDLYWAFGKRFYTYSRRLKPDDTAARRHRSARQWLFLGSFPWDSIPDQATLNRRRPRPPPVEHGPPILGRLQTPGPDPIPLTRWGRIREDYRARGLLQFRSAWEIYLEQRPTCDTPTAVAIATVDDVGPTGTGGDVNPATGRPYSLADFL